MREGSGEVNKPKQRGAFSKLGIMAVAVLIWTVAAGCQGLVRADSSSGQAAAGQRDDAQETAAPAAPEVGRRAPSFTLTALDGGSYGVDGGSRDKVLLINFWASWCDPCKLEAPDLVKLYKNYREHLDIYAVNVTYLDSEEDAKSFAEQYGFRFPVLLDPDNKVTKLYRVIGYPTTVLVDKKGVIRQIVLGIRSYEEMERYVKDVI